MPLGATAPRPEPGGAPDWALLFAGFPVAILVVDDAGHVRHANAAAEALLNLSERAMAGAPLATVLKTPATSDVVGRAVTAFDHDIGTDRTGRLRVDYAEAAVPEWPGWRTIALHPPGGARGVGQSADRGGTRAVTGAAAMLAHEIKNPLSGIRGAAQLLAGEGGNTELTALITSEVDRIAGLIDRMQNLAGRAVSLGPANLYPLVDHARRLAQAGFAAEIAFDDRFDPSLPLAMIDADALVQILINLLKNAAEALGDAMAPRIVLTTAYRPGFAIDTGEGRARRPLPIELCVIDNGPGPPPEIADHLFDPFVSGRPEGQGLGLALVDKLVRDMGGVVQFAREGQPEATVFRILLARAP